MKSLFLITLLLLGVEAFAQPGQGPYPGKGGSGSGNGFPLSNNGNANTYSVTNLASITGSNGAAVVFGSSPSNSVAVSGSFYATNGTVLIRQYIGVTNFTIPQNPPYQWVVGDGTNQLVTLPNITNGVPDGWTFTVACANTGSGSIILTNANGIQTVYQTNSTSITVTNRLTVVCNLPKGIWE